MAKNAPVREKFKLRICDMSEHVCHILVSVWKTCLYVAKEINIGTILFKSTALYTRSVKKIQHNEIFFDFLFIIF